MASTLGVRNYRAPSKACLPHKQPFEPARDQYKSKHNLIRHKGATRERFLHKWNITVFLKLFNSVLNRFRQIYNRKFNKEKTRSTRSESILSEILKYISLEIMNFELFNKIQFRKFHANIPWIILATCKMENSKYTIYTKILFIFIEIFFYMKKLNVGEYPYKII